VAEAMMVLCPKCKSEIDVEEEELEEGELLSCTECDCDFEVASVEPLKLTKVIDEEEADEDDE
jgi:alpha-aminoadipate carrier protein LysW